jgi:hypothetical protein
MLFEIITWLPQRRFRRITAVKIKVLEDALVSIRKEKARALKNGATTLIELHDTTLYLLLLSLDHSVLLYDLAVERNDFRKSVYSKHLILLFSEFFDDFPVLLGSKVRAAVQTLPHSSDHLAALDKIYKGLRSYRKAHEKEFYRIRNIVAAHRDLNAELQLSALESIDHKVIQQLAADFETWLNQVWSFISAAVNDYSNSMQIIRDVCKKIEQDAAANP